MPLLLTGLLSEANDLLVTALEVAGDEEMPYENRMLATAAAGLLLVTDRLDRAIEALDRIDRRYTQSPYAEPGPGGGAGGPTING